MTSDEIAINSINETTLALSNQHAAIEKVMADPSSDVKMLMLGPYVLYMHKKERKACKEHKVHGAIYKDKPKFRCLTCENKFGCAALVLLGVGITAVMISAVVCDSHVCN